MQVVGGMVASKNYNIAPTHVVPIVRNFRGAPTLGPATWGYPPKTVFNARGETAMHKPMFQGSDTCLFVMDGWYEWNAGDDGKKQPWFTHREDGKPILVAGLCKNFEGKVHATMVTTAATGDMEWLHHRMPRVLVGDEASTWLEGGEVAEMITHPAQDSWPELRSHKVGREVGSVRHNNAGLIEPVG